MILGMLINYIAYLSKQGYGALRGTGPRYPTCTERTTFLPLLLSPLGSMSDRAAEYLAKAKALKQQIHDGKTPALALPIA